jgi:hypothetical protein
MVTGGLLPRTIHTRVAYHRLVPEARGVGLTDAEALKCLAARLALGLDSAVDHFHRAAARRALADLRGLLTGRDPSAELDPTTATRPVGVHRSMRDLGQKANCRAKSS